MHHLEDLSLILRGRCSTRSIFVSFCVAGAALGAPSERSAEVQRRLSTMGSGCLCVAGAALGAPQFHFAWQAQHLEHLGLILRGTRGRGSIGAPESHFFAWQVQHWKHCSCVLRLRGNTINTTASTQHHLHNIIYTAPSTQHHQHTIPSTQHHLHNTIFTTSSTLHHHIPAGAALGALPSYPFCLIPADTPLVILRCGLFFVLFRWPSSTPGCPDTLLTCGVVRSYNFEIC